MLYKVIGEIIEGGVVTQRYHSQLSLAEVHVLPFVQELFGRGYWVGGLGCVCGSV